MEEALLAGIAINGPWKTFVEDARDPNRRHYAWGYSLRTDISPEAAEALKAGDRKRRIKNGTKVYLAYWEPGQDELANIFRIGFVDYIRRDGHFISFAFHLDEMVQLKTSIPRDSLLLRYVDEASIVPATPA